MAKLKVLVRLSDNAQLPWNHHLAKQTNEFREKIIAVSDSGVTADQRRIADLEAQIAKMNNHSQETPEITPDATEPRDDAENPPNDAESQPAPEGDPEGDPEGTVSGKLYGDWTKDDLLQFALEKFNVDLPNRSRKADIFMACQKLEG